MALSSPGIGSGIDVRGIVQKLMSVEQQPLMKLNTRVVELKSQLSAYGSLKGAVSTFRDAIEKLSDLSKFKAFSARSSDDAVLGSSASSAAAKGIYSLEVTRIAENHRMASGTAFGGTDTVIGSAGDLMRIKVGSNDFEIDYGGKSLATIRDEINAASTNTGVTASLLKDNSGYRLTLAANGVGSSSAIGVKHFNGGAEIPDPFAMMTLNQDRDASGGFNIEDLDAAVRLEGQFDITSSSNTLTDVIQGVTLSLKKAGTVTVNVDRDTAAVQSSVQAVVKSYSDLVTIMTKMKGEVLKSESSTLSSIQNQLRAVLNGRVDVGGAFSSALEAGISTQKNGTLTLNTKILNDAIVQDFDGMAKLFADPDKGLATRLFQLADSFLKTGALFDGRTQGLDSQIRAEQSRKAGIEERLKIVEGRLFKQYYNLDSVVSRLQGTNSALSSQLDAITNFNRNNNR